MLDRFDGDDGKRRLTDILSRQMALTCSGSIAETLAGLVTVRAVPDRAILIQQDGNDTDLYFVLSGRVSVQVNGREVAVREPGTHVGEMAMIDPAAKRCANVVSIGETVVAVVAELSNSRNSHSGIRSCGGCWPWSWATAFDSGMNWSHQESSPFIVHRLVSRGIADTRGRLSQAYNTTISTLGCGPAIFSSRRRMYPIDDSAGRCPDKPISRYWSFRWMTWVTSRGDRSDAPRD